MPHHGRPPLTTVGGADVPSRVPDPRVPDEFKRIGAFIKQELEVIDGEVEQLSAKLSVLEARRRQLGHDLDHLSAAIRILERFHGRIAETLPAPFASGETDCGDSNRSS